ncbi:hypothetical protein HDU97_003752 [Phlyctochytrium planicorne]|nr:hypothetical protein HDU97_003752 [Phlyctochytrium planicorne]
MLKRIAFLYSIVSSCKRLNFVKALKNLNIVALGKANSILLIAVMKVSTFVMLLGASSVQTSLAYTSNSLQSSSISTILSKASTSLILTLITSPFASSHATHSTKQPIPRKRRSLKESTISQHQQRRIHINHGNGVPSHSQADGEDEQIDYELNFVSDDHPPELEDDFEVYMVDEEHPEELEEEGEEGVAIRFVHDEHPAELEGEGHEDHGAHIRFVHDDHPPELEEEYKHHHHDGEGEEEHSINLDDWEDLIDHIEQENEDEDHESHQEEEEEDPDAADHSQEGINLHFHSPTDVDDHDYIDETTKTYHPDSHMETHKRHHPGSHVKVEKAKEQHGSHAAHRKDYHAAKSAASVPPPKLNATTVAMPSNEMPVMARNGTQIQKNPAKPHEQSSHHNQHHEKKEHIAEPGSKLPNVGKGRHAIKAASHVDPDEYRRMTHTDAKVAEATHAAHEGEVMTKQEKDHQDHGAHKDSPEMTMEPPKKEERKKLNSSPLAMVIAGIALAITIAI